MDPFVEAEEQATAALRAKYDSLPPDLYGSPTEPGRCVRCGVRAGSGYRSPGCRDCPR